MKEQYGAIHKAAFESTWKDNSALSAYHSYMCNKPVGDNITASTIIVFLGLRHTFSVKLLINTHDWPPPAPLGANQIIIIIIIIAYGDCLSNVKQCTYG